MKDHPEKDHARPSEPKTYTHLVQIYLSRGLLVDEERALTTEGAEATGPDMRAPS